MNTERVLAAACWLCLCAGRLLFDTIVQCMMSADCTWIKTHLRLL